MRTATRFFIVGGAGFIGGHVSDHLLAQPEVEGVTVYDNFSSGREWHVAAHQNDGRFAVIRDDVRNLDALTEAMDGCDTVIHLASNPDIAAAATNPMIDFDQGTLLTQNVVEAMRRTGTAQILYASGSGVYGDLGEFEAYEDYGPMIPTSTYGASKLAGEALISSYCAMFGLTGCAFRFGNVVGPRQTHGVGFDFLRRLLADDGHLTILGDGRQSKSYIHVSDVIAAVFLAAQLSERPFSTYNVATGDYITVTEIAELAISAIGGSLDRTQIHYTGGDRGWRGDVPIVRLNTERIRDLGWSNAMNTREALASSLDALLVDFKNGNVSL
ncbi:MAG: NAD-dependent epimerase/dehydratase family protein [Acidimicrobiales bacterium]